MKCLNKFKEIINNWLRDKTMEQYEKYLLANKGKKCRFHVVNISCGLFKLKFNTESKHNWRPLTRFYCPSDKEEIQYYEQTFSYTGLNEFMKTHPMIDDILKDFEADKERIDREIQRQRDYKRSYNIY